MVTVRFSYVNEFLDELRHAGDGGILSNTVRVTQQWRSHKTLPIRSLSVIATYVKGETLVLLEQDMGELWNTERDKEIYEKANNTMQTIEGTAEKLGMEIRAGIYELERGH